MACLAHAASLVFFAAVTFAGPFCHLKLGASAAFGFAGNETSLTHNFPCLFCVASGNLSCLLAVASLAFWACESLQTASHRPCTKPHVVQLQFGCLRMCSHW